MIGGRHKVYIDTNSPFALGVFVETLTALIAERLQKGYTGIVFLCIGTDRSTGDSLGPIVGYKLSDHSFQNIYVVGTLDNPVHAKNFDHALDYIKTLCAVPLVVAIDACLGEPEIIGHISVGKGPIKPGSALRKDLAEVGDIFITGIVNFAGSLDFLTLQNTRLSTVMRMADIISCGIKNILPNIAFVKQF